MQASRIICASAQIASKPLARALKRNKASTGIVGIQVHPDPLNKLRQVYQDTLKAVDGLPKQYVYRQAIEALTQHRLELVDQASKQSAEAQDIEPALVQLEQAADQGSVEQLIQVAQDELALIDKMKEWQSYEALQTKPDPEQWQSFDVPPSTTMPTP